MKYQDDLSSYPINNEILNTLILQCGSYSCKSGWSLNPLPSIELLQQPYDVEANLLSTYYGWRTKNLRKYDRNYTESLWIHSAESLLQNNNTSEFPVWISDPLLIDSKFHSLAAEVFFECLNVPYLCITNEETALQASLKQISLLRYRPGYNNAMNASSSFHNDKDTAIIIDCGYETIRLWPYFSGFPARDLAMTFPLGCRTSIGLIHSLLHRNDKSYQSASLKELNDTTTTTQQNHHCCWNLAKTLFETLSSTSVDLGVDSWRLKQKTREEYDDSLIIQDNKIPTSKCINNFTTEHSIKRLCNQFKLWKSEKTQQQLKDLPPCQCIICLDVLEKEHQSDSDKLALSHQNHLQSSNIETKRSMIPSPSLLTDILRYPTFKRQDIEYLLSKSPETHFLIRQTLGEGQFLATELFFQPRKLLPLLFEPTNQSYSSRINIDGIAHSTLNLFNASPIDYRKRLYSNVIVLGNLSTIPSFPRRLAEEIQAELFSRLKNVSAGSATESVARLKIEVSAPQNPLEAQYATWIGCRALALTTNFEGTSHGGIEMLTRDKYMEGTMDDDTEPSHGVCI